MKTKIQSLPELQKRMPRILKAVNADPDLALAAGANPFFALEKLGYELTPQAQKSIERHARFGKEISKEVQTLEKSILEMADQPIPLDDNKKLGAWVSARIKVLKGGKGKKSQKEASQRKKEKQFLDQTLTFFESSLATGFQLEALESEHIEALEKLDPLFSKLIRYQILQIRYPRFASQEVFEKILSKQIKTPITGITWRLQDANLRKKKK
jgi:hypothetical protein